jgi:hypothetical protein
MRLNFSAFCKFKIPLLNRSTEGFFMGLLYGVCAAGTMLARFLGIPAARIET